MESIHAVETKVVWTPRSALVGKSIEGNGLAIHRDDCRPAVVGIKMNRGILERYSPYVPHPPTIGRFRALACGLPIIGLRRVDFDVRRRMPTAHGQVHVCEG